MKFQYIYEFLAQLSIKQKVFLHYKSMLSQKDQLLLRKAITNVAPIGAGTDMLTITLPYNLELLNLLSKLKELGYITYTVHMRTVVVIVNIFSYSKIIVHSKPSRQIFKRSNSSLWTRDTGMGVSILRTSQGFLTSVEAKKLKIGGELLFSIQ